MIPGDLDHWPEWSSVYMQIATTYALISLHDVSRKVLEADYHNWKHELWSDNEVTP
jgi:hypothetical protein